MNKIPVGKTIAYAYSFTFGHLGTVIGLSWLPIALFSACMYFTMNAYLDGWIAFLREQNPGELGPAIALFLLGVSAAIALNGIVAVVLTRQALGMRSGPARVYLAFGRSEWRAFGALVRLSLLIFGLTFVLMIASGIIAGLVGMVTQTSNQPIVVGEVVSPTVALTTTLVMIAGGIAILYVLIRTSFMMPAIIVAEDTPDPLRASWTLGRANFWRMIAVQVAVVVPVVILQELVAWIIEKPVAPPGVPGSVEHTIAEFTAAQNQLPLSTAMSAAAYLLIFPLIYSAAAFAYRALVPVPMRAQAANDYLTPPP